MRILRTLELPDAVEEHPLPRYPDVLDPAVDDYPGGVLDVELLRIFRVLPGIYLSIFQVRNPLSDPTQDLYSPLVVEACGGLKVDKLHGQDASRTRY